MEAQSAAEMRFRQIRGTKIVEYFAGFPAEHGPRIAEDGLGCELIEHGQASIDGRFHGGILSRGMAEAVQPDQQQQQILQKLWSRGQWQTVESPQNQSQQQTASHATSQRDGP